MHSDEAVRRLLRSHGNELRTNRRDRKASDDKENEVHGRTEVPVDGRRDGYREGAQEMQMSVQENRVGLQQFAKVHRQSMPM